ncbi:hypothetical protein ABH14_09970 [Brevibacillus brevis]|nr:hypothetical protein [Brevibacillus brevis]
MKEGSIVRLEKNIGFEGSGETVSIQIVIENVAPDRVKLILGPLDVIYKDLKEYLALNSFRK